MIKKHYRKQDLLIIASIIAVIISILIIYPSNNIELYFGKSRAIIDKTHKSILVRSNYNSEETIVYRVYPNIVRLYIKPIYFGSQYGLIKESKTIRIHNNKKYLIKDLGAFSTLTVDYGLIKKKFSLYIIDGDLPVMSIKSNNKFLDIKSEKYTPVVADMISDSGSYILKNKESSIEQRGRYGLKYNLRLSKAQSIFNSSKRKKWSLYGDPYDLSRIRDKLAFDLYDKLTPEKVVPKSFFVELFINYKYMGIYTLEERYDRTLFDYEKYNKKFISPAMIFKCNEGLFFDKDKYNEKAVVDNYHRTFMQIKPDIEKIDYRHVIWDLLKFILFSKDNEFFDKENGIFSKIDQERFIDLFLFLQVTKNVDGVSNNLYFSRKEIKNKNDKELFIISSWDHDKSFGKRITDKEDHTGLVGIDAGRKNYLFQRLINDKQFKNLLKERWFILRKNIWSSQNIDDLIKDYFKLFDNAVYRNSNHEAYLKTKNNEFNQIDDINFIADWLELRLAWLDDYFKNI